MIVPRQQGIEVEGKKAIESTKQKETFEDNMTIVPGGGNMKYRS